MMFVSKPHPDRRQQFRAVAVPTREIREPRSSVSSICNNCNKVAGEGAELRTCSGCKSVSYCNRGCQRAHWAKHKLHCGQAAAEGPGIKKLVANFKANRMLSHFLQVCLALEFDLHTSPSPDTPFFVNIDVGIEPCKITDFMNLFTHGAKFDKAIMEGMLQLDHLASERSGMPSRPLTATQRTVWEFAREESRKAGSGENAVVVVQFLNNCSQAITCTFVVTDEALEEAREAEPFVVGSALTGAKTTQPLNINTCLEFINTHIRSDVRNQLLLRADMRDSDKQLIRDAGRDKNAHAPQALLLKMKRESVYVSHPIVVNV
ncbi:hypothetical protein B0H34DRAFT_180141 [Crassisporium funariophilum]|nr:hypothetical protein B0H34DRAFT_180141 [Crassisporium funariophilum]